MQSGFWDAAVVDSLIRSFGLNHEQEVWTQHIEDHIIRRDLHP